MVCSIGSSGYQGHQQSLENRRFREISFSAHEYKYASKYQAWIDEVTHSENDPICAVGVGDCIAIFGIEKDREKITRISCYHPSASTSVDEIEKMFSIFQGSAEQVEFYIIGGNKETTEEGALISKIREWIESKFGTRDCIKEELLNICSEDECITAGLNIEGELGYCILECFDFYELPSISPTEKERL